MTQRTTIENPIVTSPFEIPQRHFELRADGSIGPLQRGRRPAGYVQAMPAAQKKRLKKENLLFADDPQEQYNENPFVNDIRARIAQWREQGYPGVTNVTSRLLEYWQRPDRDRRLFFAQLEAAETAIYLLEVAEKAGDQWMLNKLREDAAELNAGMLRIAFKMATGSGKTTVMAMLIAYHILNKQAYPQDARFGDSFLIVSPGITIRDRLRVLRPNDEYSTYKFHDLVPPDQRPKLERATIEIINYHAFLPRELKIVKGVSSKTKKLLGADKTGAFSESPAQMVNRAVGSLKGKKNIVVLNDEAHHCYRVKAEKDKSEDAQAARTWSAGLEAIQEKLGIRAVYDLSATPFFLSGSGHGEGTPFPWVVTDFPLIEAIESGLVKVPRIPVADNQDGDQPAYRHLWPHIRDALPKGNAKDLKQDTPELPDMLEGALYSLYTDYEKRYAHWEEKSKARGQTPPVFIVVCANTATSKIVYDWISGYHKQIDEETSIWVEGKLDKFSNVQNGQPLSRPLTVLVDSAQLDSGEAFSDDFKAAAAEEIAAFRAEYARSQGKQVTDLGEVTSEELLREVMNTVGRPGKLGEHVRCVVSVSMLTEGWDANTVTHVLGVRAFGTQLLQEQVVGRALRRISYAASEMTVEVDGQPETFQAFSPEYAEVYGIPFDFLPVAGGGDSEPDPRERTRVRALEERADLAITFPKVLGYRYEVPVELLKATFDPADRFVVSTANIPTETLVAPPVGHASIHDLEALREIRPQRVALELSRLVLERHYRSREGDLKDWLFPQIYRITGDWLQQSLYLADDTFIQLLLLSELSGKAADHIQSRIAAAPESQRQLLPVLSAYETLGSTHGIDFQTVKEVQETTRSHVSHVTKDSGWEGQVAQSLEAMPEVLTYVKNQGMEFTIPYTDGKRNRDYYPDFIVLLDDGKGAADPLQLVLEVTGDVYDPLKHIKVKTARDRWVPAVNNHGQFGRWVFLQVTDPHDVKNRIRQMMNANPFSAMEAQA